MVQRGQLVLILNFLGSIPACFFILIFFTFHCLSLCGTIMLPFSSFPFPCRYFDVALLKNERPG